VSAELEAVQADSTAPVDGVVVPLITADAKAEIVVPPPGRWKTRANRALREGDFDGWAELVLSPEDYDAWVDADPTNDDVEAFFTFWRDTSGQDPKGSRVSQASSRGTRRR